MKLWKNRKIRKCGRDLILKRGVYKVTTVKFTKRQKNKKFEVQKVEKY